MSFKLDFISVKCSETTRYFIRVYKSSIVVSIYFSRHSFLLYLNILFINNSSNLIFNFSIIYLFIFICFLYILSNISRI